MPCLRVTCATVTPASPSFRIATICDSVNRDFFIRTSGEISCQKNPVIAVYREGELTGRDPKRQRRGRAQNGSERIQYKHCERAPWSVVMNQHQADRI